MYSFLLSLLLLPFPFSNLIMNYLSLLVFITLVQWVYCWSPTNGYAPGKVSCPNDDDFVRDATTISSDEKSWLKGRNEVTDENLIEFLENANMTDFDASDFINNKANRSLTIGLAFSGGGYRAMLAGAGQLAALDSRTDNATNAGLGGLLQSSTYLVGLSGGNWLVGTIAMNNFTSVQDILEGGKIWDLEHSMINPGGWNLVKTYKYYKGINDDLDDKRNAGFDVSLTDTWGRALSNQFFANTSNAGAGLTWSTITNASVFTDYDMPFPISVADGRTPGQTIVSSNSTVFEINPFELGSWDPSLYQFTKTRYLGTTVKDGKPSNGTCVAGFDNAGYIMGTSSTLFNQFILQINTTSLSSSIKSIITSLLKKVSDVDNDIAVYKPNPFYKTDTGDVRSIAKNQSLYLVDGGEDLQNIPLYPLLQPERKLDVIFAYDNSADTDESWPNGTSMVASYERQFLDQGNGTIFPHVPDTASFRNLNLTAKPAFFGCDAKNLSSLLDKTNSSSSKDYIYNTPLIVYTANRPFSYFSNTSTFKLSYDESEKRGLIQNGFETASRLNNTLDSDWPACVGCAIIRREQERQDIEQSDQCKECFDKYCWDGSTDDSTPGVNFTETGTTTGKEDTGNSTSGASSLIWNKGDKYNLLKLIGYALLASLAFCVSF